MFKPVDPKQNFPKMEEEILKFWEKNKIFEKSVEKNPAENPFIFYEGPPTANGRPGLHHVLARSFKDIIPRYKTMKGFRVERKAGWDTHGLPVEIQVEKELGIHTKPEIENIVPGNVRESVIEFNRKCKESVWRYKDLWEKMTERMAYWVDMKNPYVTYENEYIESVWWVFAQIWKTKGKDGKSLVYRGSKVLPYCYRCGTGLSSHEVAQGYQTVKDNSIFLKFKAKKDGKIIMDENTYFLVWTTTPWTLPGNVALAAGKDIDYVKAEVNGEALILARERIMALDGEFKIKGEFKGEKLLDLEYEPLYETTQEKNVHKIVHGDFISTEDGTGIVHIAPAFGEDDANVARENGLPTVVTVDEAGKISAEVPGKGIAVKKKNAKNRYEADDLIIEDLNKRKLLFREEVYEHEYPHCWRCDMPLIYYAKPSWFVRMSELSEKLVKNNEKVNWVPEHIKSGRFGEWLQNVKDWAISRERYWGTPLPIWVCEKCGAEKAVESIAEIEKMSGQKIEDLHKPYIDEIELNCECGEKMRRTPEVMDVWFDSGAMPLAQFGYPNSAAKEDKEKIESGKYFPADYISEAIDQTRGWFYTLHAIATILNLEKKVPTGNAFKNVICLGHILDAKGKKMSKSRGNVIEPMEVMDKFGADMLRWMLFSINQPGMAKKFDLKGMSDIMNRVFRMLWNSYYFFVMYANIDKFVPKSQISNLKSQNLLDKWIVSELCSLSKEVGEKLEKYDIYGPTKLIEKFIDNLSNWYIRRSRKRFWKSENDTDKTQAYETLHYVLTELSKLTAPFIPFVSEEIYKNLSGEESVHLADFPVLHENFIDGELNEQMSLTRRFVKLGLAARAKAGIKVRQPLSELQINQPVDRQLVDLIKEEVNVKKVNFYGTVEKQPGIYTEEEGKWMVGLDISISEDLRLEGEARELIRRIQELRKKAGYEVDNRITICYKGGSGIFDKFGELIAKETLAEGVFEADNPESDISEFIDLDVEPIKIWLKKV
ncbi:MAG: isoleucine--tRNA ligase [Parcubacteria group bacterium]|jgi:isoleucyl-tRNA synthetase